MLLGGATEGDGCGVGECKDPVQSGGGVPVLLCGVIKPAWLMLEVAEAAWQLYLKLLGCCCATLQPHC